MGIFDGIMSRIFGRRAEAEPPAGTPVAEPGQAPPGPAAIPGATFGVPPETALRPAPGAASADPGAAPPGPAAIPGAAAAPVDVGALLAGMAAQSPRTLDWQHSIVDLMTLLGLDSSLPARQELARELGYTGRTDGSAEMNLWLHGEVMRRLAAHGGRVPPELMQG